MFAPVNYSYAAVLQTIRIIKWFEFQLLRLFKPFIKRKAIEISESIGAVFHDIPIDQNDNHDVPKISASEESRILAKCKGKYNKLIHIKMFDDNYFVRVANKGSLECGQTFMEGNVWDVFANNHDDMVEFTKRALENNLTDLYWNPWNRALEYLELCAFNLQTKQRAYQVGEEHYDLGNDLYELMLDPWMQYTCAYWAKADNLNQAQIDKMELIAKKLDLKPGMRVLDIGCGWGTLCKYLAQNYGVSCVGVTISKEGVAYGNMISKGLPVEIRLQDYRDVNETFDRVVSIGCMEHVGQSNYREFMQVARRCLKDDGIFLLHTISRNHANFPRSERWLHTYIFPNGQLPNPKDMAEALHGNFIIEDWHNFGPDYAKTLKAWRNNFYQNWPKIQHKYGERFYKMWIYYLCLCEGGFLSRRVHLWQLVLSKDGLQREYRAAR